MSPRLEREGGADVITFHEAATFVRVGGRSLAKRTLLLPELWVRTDGLGTYRLGPLDNGDPDAVAFSLASFAERVQDDVIDELWGAWPPCPRHDHPLQATKRRSPRRLGLPSRRRPRRRRRRPPTVITRAVVPAGHTRRRTVTDLSRSRP